MCADKKIGQATAEAAWSTHFRARAREASARTKRRRAASATRKRLRVAAKLRLAFCILGGRRFTSGIPMRAVAHCMSRWFTREKSAPSTSHDLRVTNHGLRGGTVNRPRTHVSHRKQRIGHMQGRNFPVHFLFLFSARFLRVVRPFLPETVNRVETHLSHRKQTVGYASTRNVPAHDYFRILFARVRALARRAQRQIVGETPAPQEKSRSLTHIPDRQRRDWVRDDNRTNCASRNETYGAASADDCHPDRGHRLADEGSAFAVLPAGRRRRSGFSGAHENIPFAFCSPRANIRSRNHRSGSTRSLAPSGMMGPPACLPRAQD